MANEVIIKRGLKSAYTGLAKKDANTVYFITDTGEIYVGETLYSGEGPDLSNYVTKDGSSSITGTLDATGGKVKVATPQDTTDATPKKYVDDEISKAVSAVDAMTFKGTLGTDGTITALPTSVKNGDTYKVITADTYAGQVCEVGDLVIATKTTTSAKDADWVVVQSNIDGAVTGPTSSTGNNLAAFDGATGKVIKDSGLTTENVSSAVTMKHEHANKEALDTYTKTQTEIETEIDNAKLRWVTIS